MVKRNTHLAKLQSGYLFPEIAKRKRLFLESNPAAKLISLGIGDTTEPIPEGMAKRMAQTAADLATRKGYSGYGPEQGSDALRKALSEKMYKGNISPEDIFISDGAKCDIGRLQVLLGSDASISVQDPSYPAYVDTGVALGQTNAYNAKTKQYEKIHYMPCLPENGFFPLLSKTARTDVIFFCSPNNPTGEAATADQLQELVTFAKQNHSLIIYDAAYASYIEDDRTPSSIYEIPGADEVAIELGSFSKMAGFTGVRLGWSVVPKRLVYEDGGSIHQDWNRIYTTFFNGASNIAQAGGLAALCDEGKGEMLKMQAFYKENCRMLKSAFEKMGHPVYGGIHAPYLWVHYPKMTSWQAFEWLLNKKHLVCTPGSGFGPAGEGYIRVSAFAPRASIEEAIQRLENSYEY